MLLADMAQVIEFLKDTTISAVTRIFLFLSMGIYNLITIMYAIFKTIAEARFVTADTIKDLTSRLYLLVGIIALFLVAYSFLMVIVNPENINKGKFATTKMVKNIVLSVIAITFIPTVFNLSYAVQKSVLDRDVIGKIILDRGSGDIDTGEDYLADFSIAIFESSFYLRDMSETADPDAVAQYDSCAAQSKLYSNIMFFSACSDLISDGKAEFNPILSLLVGLFAVYVLGIYCMDMGLRAVKLVVLQIIAPIPCLMMIIPEQDKVFKSWVKNVVKTFLEVFLKIAILTLGVYMIQLLSNITQHYGKEAFGPMYGVLGVWINLFVILGILMFINQAPKLLSDIFGFDLGHGFSLKKRLDDVKEGWKTVTAPARAAGHALNKGIGAGMGLYFANKARKKAEADGAPKSGKVKTAWSNFMGLRNGWRGGIRNSGSAYSYEQLMQQSYALDSTKSDKEQFKNAVFDRARSFIGRDTRYDEEIRDQAIIRDRKNALLKQQQQEIEHATGEKVRRINRDYEDTLEANKEVADKGDAIKDAVDKQTNKVDSNIRVSMEDIYKGYETKLKDKIDDVSTTDAERERLKVELANLQKAKAISGIISPAATPVSNILGPDGQPIQSQPAGEFISDSYNRSDMQSKIAFIQKMSDGEMPQEVKSALISMLHHGEDMANEKYIKDFRNWDTEVKVAVSNARMVAGDIDAGHIAVQSRDADGNLEWLDAEHTVPKIVKSEAPAHDFSADFKAAAYAIDHAEQIEKQLKAYDERIANAATDAERQALQERKDRFEQKYCNNAEYAKLLKVSKEAKKLVNTDTEAKNTRLTTEKVTVNMTVEKVRDGKVVYEVEKTGPKNLNEWQGDSKRRDREIKDNNQAYERFVESHDNLKEVTEAKKKARDAAPKGQKPKN